MNERFPDHVLAEYLHPISIVFRLAVTGGIYAMIVDGPQQLPHREFVHQRLEFIFKREHRRLVPLFPLFRRSRCAVGGLSHGVGYGIAQPE